MSKELYKNKLMINSPTSISLGHITWFALDTKLVGRIKALLKERDDLQSKIDESDELIETYKNERDTYKRLAEEYINKYNKEKEKNKRAINRVSIVRMDNDITIDTNRVLDYILKSLIGE